MPSLVPSRRGKVERAARTARKLTLARAALSLLQTKLGGKVPGVPRKRRVTPARAAVLGGALAGVAGLVRSRRSGARTDVPPPPPAAAGTAPPAPPVPSNYDAPVPVAPPAPMGDLDEAAESAAAAAEAGSIGGPSPDYAAAPEPARDDPDGPPASGT